MRIQIHRFDLVALVGAPLDKVAKVLERVMALLAHLHRLITADIKLLDRALETDAQRVGGDEQDLAHGA